MKSLKSTQNRLTFFLLLFSFLLISNVFASDSLPKYRGPILFSITAGYSQNGVYGSMVDRNEQFSKTVQQKDKQGLAIGFDLRKEVGKQSYFETGINFLQKKVNPQENSGTYYKDRLNTVYLSVPILFGYNLLPAKQGKLNISLEFGPSINFVLKDNSYFGPDRKSTNTKAINISLLPGACLAYSVRPDLNFLVRYTYLYDITDAYVEDLYWGSTTEPIKRFTYKYKSHLFSLGFQWPIGKKF